MKVLAQWIGNKSRNPGKDRVTQQTLDNLEEKKSACLGIFKVTGKQVFSNQGCELCKDSRLQSPLCNDQLKIQDKAKHGQKANSVSFCEVFQLQAPWMQKLSSKISLLHAYNEEQPVTLFISNSIVLHFEKPLTLEMSCFV